MSIPLLIYWILAKIMLAVDSAPLGNGIFDPLVSSVEASDSYLSNKMALSILRKNVSPEELINRGLYDGYIFNQNRCIQFNNRILCGYDKNQGTQLDDYTMLDIGNGCRSRGDRIECGYDDPRLYKNLRHPGIKDGEPEQHNEHSEHGEHDTLHENIHHNHGGNHHHEGHHHHGGNLHHEDEHQSSLARQAPTRTIMKMNPTTQSIILNRIKTDYLENKLLKTVFDKLAMKDKNTGSVKTTRNLIKPIKSPTNTVKLLTTITTKPTIRELTATSKRQKYRTTTSKAATMTSTTEISTTLATISESNDISDGETIKRIINLAPVRKQKRRRLTERLSKLPELVSKSVADGTVVPPITIIYETTSNSAVLRKKTSGEETVKSACVEQGDRVVCYDFKI